MQSQIDNIFRYCRQHPDELFLLMDRVIAPMHSNANTLSPKALSVRMNYQVCLPMKKMSLIPNSASRPPVHQAKPSRYKATTEGDAANSVIRAILSNLGTESFSRHDLEETKRYFLNRCTYYEENNPNCDETILTHRDLASCGAFPGDEETAASNAPRRLVEQS